MVACPEAADAVGIARVEDTVIEEVRLPHDRRLSRRLEFGSGNSLRGESAGELEVRQEVIEHRRRMDRRLGKVEVGVAHEISARPRADRSTADERLRSERELIDLVESL